MVDPGLTKSTGLSRDAKGGTAVAAKMFFSIAGRPVDRGAATYIDAVLGHSKESHGCFLMNCKIAPYVTILQVPVSWNILLTTSRDPQTRLLVLHRRQGIDRPDLGRDASRTQFRGR